MLLKPEQLRRHAEEPLQPLYFVGGDELLLVEDACQAIVKAVSYTHLTLPTNREV